MATITKSIWGNSYDVEYVISGCVHHRHFDTNEEAVIFVKKLSQINKK